MSKKTWYVIGLIQLFNNSLYAQSVTVSSIPNDPATPGIASSFDWQTAWGTIHMNSLADGLLDPGSPVTSNGIIPCPKGDVCKDLPNGPLYLTKSIAPSSIAHGIKYDIKNSVLNCMSIQRPNFPTNNGGWASQYSKVRCDAVGTFVHYPSTPNYPNNTAKLADLGKLPTSPTLIYSPLWDPRSHDERDYASAARPAGCIQQIINNCVEDIHDCRPIAGRHDANPMSDNAAAARVPGYTQPVTHVFTPQEVMDLGGPGKALPTVYYSYIKAIKTKPEVDIDNADFPPAYEFVLVADPSPADPDKKRIREVLSKRVALSRVDSVDGSHGQVYGTDVSTINNDRDPNLARIASYMVNDMGNDIRAKSDISGLIIVDPSRFFDVRLYAPGGEFNSNYTTVDTKGLVKTPDSCPILGLQSGYSGICDPTGEAGCNLPVYGIGPQTTFTSSGSSYTYNHHPIVWSGYVKKWAVITVAQYLENVRGRVGVNGGQLYAGADDINDGPILMLTRSNSYCDSRERYMGVNSDKQEIYLDKCVQYKQYQNYGTESNPMFGFVDLFQPKEDPGPQAKFAFSTIRTFHTRDGVPQAHRPVAGNHGSQHRLVGNFKANNVTSYISFLELDPTIKYTNTITRRDGGTKIELLPAIERKDYVTSPILNTKAERTIGSYVDVAAEDVQYFGVDKTKYGTSLELEKGLAYAFRLPDTRDSAKFNVNKEDGRFDLTSEISTRCAIVTTPPLLTHDHTGKPITEKAVLDLDRKMFIPTNSQEELDAFLKSTWALPGVPPASQPLMVRAGLVSRNCEAKYMTYGQLKDPKKAATNPNGTNTWVGLTKCSQLTVKPSCNQTQIITAQRYCMLEDGIQGQCDECRNAVDIDKEQNKVDFSLAAVSSGLGNAEILSDPYKGGSLCYFSAACFNNGAVGCPPAKTTGGHVFCLSADTLITLADGTQKEIIKLKSGDRVLAFKAESSGQKNLESAMVMATAITKDQPVMKMSYSYKVNGKVVRAAIKITPEHKVVLESGRGVMAQDLRAGDVVLMAEGARAVVEEVSDENKRITVYNLVLEDGFDGYIAGGLRVLSYPILDGMDVATK